MTTRAPDYVPPQNLDAEESVLGAMLLGSAGAIEAISENVTAEDFYRRSHGIIFFAITDLYNRGEAIDAITVADALARRKTKSGENALEAVGGKFRIHELASLAPATSNAGHYAEIVHEHAVLRNLLTAGNEITSLAIERPGELDDLLARAETALTKATQNTGRADSADLSSTIDELIAEITEAKESGKPRMGFLTGFLDIDEILTGLHRGRLYLLAARPAMGKSLLALNIAENLADQSIPAAFFTLEMSREELAIRSLSREAEIDSQRLLTGRIDDEQLARVHKARGKVASRPLYAQDNPVTSNTLRAEARKLQRTHGIEVVFVDYLQLMLSGRDEESRQQEISVISRSLKLLAREMNVPIVALSQLNRNVEFRTDKRPRLSDLRDSGSIEQDADAVIFIYRDEYYNPDSDALGVAEIIVSKQRQGPTGTVKLAYVAGKSTFRNLSTLPRGATP